jgi:hypothetical protein
MVNIPGANLIYSVRVYLDWLDGNQKSLVNLGVARIP